MIAAVAGTFNVLHDGHKALIDRAFAVSDNVYIGITSDKMAGASRKRLNPYYLRKKAVEEYVSAKSDNWKIFEIDDMYGPPEMMDHVDCLVVSEDTFENGRKVSESRKERLGRPIELSVVKMVKNDHGRTLCSTDIMNGMVSKHGSSDSVDVAVGSMNPVKVEAVRHVMERIYGDVIITAVDAKGDVPEQPFGDETAKGAENRARKAIGDHDLGVGIEAGVFEMYGFLYDIQHCAVIDKNGTVTVGMGSGFRYPDRVADLVRNGMTVGDAMSRVYGTENKGRSIGAISMLSKGLLDREDLTEQSVLAAMLPRIWDEGQSKIE
jgi:inosine/xanthosine triphosphatase